MNSKFVFYLRDFSLAVLSAFFLILSFPNYNLGFLAWIGFVPLFIAIHKKSMRSSFLLSLVCGMLFFMGIFQWILIVADYTLLHHAILALYLGAYFGFFGLIINFISKRWGITQSLFASPFIWISLEYMRSNLFFLSLPWALLAHTQYQYPRVIQVASLFGTYSISFLIMMTNAALAAMTIAILYKSEGQKTVYIKSSSKRGTTALVLTATLLISFSLLYGQLIVSRPIVGKKIAVAMVQGNIEQTKKWDKKYASDIMQTYSELTQTASMNKPAIIVWPETATPGAINFNTVLYSEVRYIAKQAGTYLLLGSAQYQKFGKTGDKKFKYMNSAFLISPETETIKNQRYDKIRLLPFGEYLPMQESIPWSYINIPDINEFIPGKEFSIFEIPGARFGVVICWENIFPDLFRQFVLKGAQFMVNITNEAWFGKTVAPYQFIPMSVFRAVENRVFLIRCANTGISCIIDPYGRVIDRVKDAKGDDTFVRGVISGLIVPLQSKTIYTQYGEIFVLVAVICSVVFVLAAIFYRR